MSMGSPNGVLDITNTTVRVSKIESDEVIATNTTDSTKARVAGGTGGDIYVDSNWQGSGNTGDIIFRKGSDEKARITAGGKFQVEGDQTVQEYPPQAMTGYETYMEGHGVFEVESSSVANSNYRSVDALDKDEDPLVSTAGWVSGLYTYDTSGTGLASGGSATDYFSTYGPGSWLKLKLPYAIKLKSSTFSIRAQSNTLEPLKSFTIYGSRDNTNWDALYSQSTSTPQSFSIDINSTE